MMINVDKAWDGLDFQNLTPQITEVLKHRGSALVTLVCHETNLRRKLFEGCFWNWLVVRNIWIIFPFYICDN